MTTLAEKCAELAAGLEAMPLMYSQTSAALLHQLSALLARIAELEAALAESRKRAPEEAAMVCQEHKEDNQAHNLCRLGAKWCEQSIRELINKEQ